MEQNMSIEEKIIYLRTSGLSINEICQIVGKKKGTIGYYLKKSNLVGFKETKNKPTRRWTKFKDESSEDKSRRKSLNVINWKKEKKKLLVEYKGGQCERCGYNKCINALEFHHLDPTQKDFAISSNSFSFDRMKQEVDKCILLCSNCHREEHYS